MVPIAQAPFSSDFSFCEDIAVVVCKNAVTTGRQTYPMGLLHTSMPQAMLATAHSSRLILTDCLVLQHVTMQLPKDTYKLGTLYTKHTALKHCKESKVADGCAEARLCSLKRRSNWG